MIEPILGIVHAIERRSLDVDILVGWIKANVPNPGGVACHRAGDIHLLKIRRCDEINILPGVGHESHHRKGYKATHRSAIVVSRESAVGRLEVFRDIEVAPVRRTTWPAGIVVLEDRKKRRLVAYVGDFLVVEVIQPANESLWTTKSSN